MASYKRPDQDEIQSTTGINLAALGLAPDEMNSLISELTTKAEAEVAQIVGEARFDSASLTDRQAASLAEAVCNGVGWRFLRSPQVRKATGTHQPLLVESSRAIGDVIEECQIATRNLSRLVAAGGGTENPQVLSGGCVSATVDRCPVFHRSGDQW